MFRSGLDLYVHVALCVKRKGGVLFSSRCGHIQITISIDRKLYRHGTNNLYAGARGDHITPPSSSHGSSSHGTPPCSQDNYAYLQPD